MLNKNIYTNHVYAKTAKQKNKSPAIKKNNYSINIDRAAGPIGGLPTTEIQVKNQISTPILGQTTSINNNTGILGSKSQTTEFNINTETNGFSEQSKDLLTGEKWGGGNRYRCNANL